MDIVRRGDRAPLTVGAVAPTASVFTAFVIPSDLLLVHSCTLPPLDETETASDTERP